MTSTYADAIDQWRYPAEYAFYNLDSDPEDRAEFLDERNWPNAYYAVLDEQGALAGFFLFEPEDGSLILGLGLRPDLTGVGLGAAFVEAGLAFARQTFAPTTFRLSVAAFNQRAIRVYEQLGFTRERTFQQETNGGVCEFVEMTKSERSGTMSQDHDHINAKIDAFYEVISGPSGHAHDWPSLAALFVFGASILSFRREGAQGALAVDVYVDRLRKSLTDRDFFERGLDYRIEIQGEIAQVWSRYEASSAPDFAEIQRTGTNLIHFVQEDGAWKIAGMVYQDD